MKRQTLIFFSTISVCILMYSQLAIADGPLWSFFEYVVKENTKPAPPPTAYSQCRESCYTDHYKNEALANCDARDNGTIMTNSMHDCKNQLSMALNSCLNACN